jgi:hypothetical protein
MPPPKRRGKEADILDKVLETASLPHFVNVEDLKQQIEEQLRVLNIRARVKQFGKGDSIESRKLVLLQHNLKATAPLERKMLASAVGLKPAAFDTLCNKASHYIDVSSFNSKKRKARSSLQTSTDSTTRAAAVQSTIPALSIRLGAQVHDSHGYARRAQQLFSDMERYITTTSTISSPRKRGYLQDMQRSRATYEAACFYVTARNTRMKKSRNSSDSVEQEDTQLSIQDVIHASTSVSALDFKGILPMVQEFAMEMEKEQKKVAAATASTKKSAAATTKRKRAKSSREPTRQEESSSVDGAAQALLESVESAANGGEMRQKSSHVVDATPKFVYSPRFLQWKEKVLKETCDKEMKLSSQDSDVASTTDCQAIQIAADAIIRRNSIL